MRSAIATYALLLQLPAAADPHEQRGTYQSPDTHALRRLTVDDLLAVERVDEVVPSPDGNWFAVTIIRGREPGEVFGHENLFGLTRSDVWLFPSSRGEARNLTQGHRDGSGYWSPVWSPDSRRLAVLSTEGGDNVRPYVIDRLSGEVERLAERGIDLDLNAGPGVLLHRRALLWTSDTTVVFSMLPAGEVAEVFVRRSPGFASLATAAWDRARLGREPTADVLDAGIEVGPESRPTRELVSIDVKTGRATTLLAATVRSVTPSPDGRRLALTTATSAVLPPRSRSLNYPNYAAGGAVTRMHGRVGMLALDPRPQVRWIPGIVDPEPFAIGRTPQWSADGKWLVVVGKEDRAADQGTIPYLVDVQGGRAARLGPPEFAVRGMMTVGAEVLLQTEVGWWAVDPETREWTPRRLTMDMPHAPESLRDVGRGRLVGIAGGDLWRIDRRTGTAKNLTVDFAPAVEELVSASSTDASASRRGCQQDGLHPTVLLSARDGASRALYKLELGARTTITPMSQPDPDARLLAYGPCTSTAVFAAAGAEGTFVWSGESGSRASFERRIVLNEHLAAIARVATRTIRYRNGDGQYLRAALLLPFGYREGERYPLVTHIYPGAMIPEHGYQAGRLHTPSPQHALELFASMGYAVLYPSIPLPDSQDAIDPMLELTTNVLPAVEAVIAMGVGDPDRLALYGHSYGAYATLGLLTQTRRFHAAIASAGFSDLLSYYSQFEMTRRYLPFAHELEQLNMAEWEREEATIRMRRLPWDDHLRYLRNSPVSYLYRIETPLLLIHGDLDAAPIGQSEAVFMGLYRLGKRARFVRYWGEGHSLDSPANIRDNWNRIFAWLDEHLNRANIGNAAGL
jgi:dipeptidyl aminopeptidase/acylaminoacyl peptidase